VPEVDLGTPNTEGWATIQTTQEGVGEALFVSLRENGQKKDSTVINQSMQEGVFIGKVGPHRGGGKDLKEKKQE